MRLCVYICDGGRNLWMNRIMSALNQVKRHLKPGQVYRRADVARWSNAVDRHLKELVEEGTLNKVSPGVYRYPKTASFGRVPPEDKKLVKAFLKSDDFLLLSPNAYNALGVGTSQFYNEQIRVGIVEHH